MKSITFFSEFRNGTTQKIIPTSISGPKCQSYFFFFCFSFTRRSNTQ